MKLTLQYPLKSIWITQKFGANSLSYYKDNGMLGHNGIDYAAKDGTSVYASHDGIAHIEIDNSGGNGVVIISEDKYEYKDKEVQFKSIYWHLKENNLFVKQWQFVKKGDLIGLADNTGFSTGSHLHFAIKPVLEGNNVEQDNGYAGAIDPQPYFNGTYPNNKYIFTKLIKYGMWNNDVKELQIRLTENNFYDNIIDGQFGPKTLKAVKNFQLQQRLFTDGIVGKKTISKLNGV